jgi:hypothetical protein
MPCMGHAPPYNRHRGWYALWLTAVIATGLASRWDAVGLPPFWAKYAGDALWALMVFVGVGLVFRGWTTLAIAGLAAAVSCMVEFSQLYHAPWLDAVRRTTLGHLALGDTFAFADIAAYLVGISFGAVIEWAARRMRAEICRWTTRSTSTGS